MQNCAAQEKSRGILAFAINTADTDYVSIARHTLELASATLGLPYTLITEPDSSINNTRFSVDSQKFVPWNNAGRYRAYELSPYDETLVIDVDYLVFDKNMCNWFDSVNDYAFMTSAHNVTHHGTNLMGAHSLPFVWATVFIFKKTPQSQLFFDLVKRIQHNYNYYRALFNVQQSNFRNDYAFAMADTVLNGYSIKRRGLPGPMLNIDHAITSIEPRGDFFVVRDADHAVMVPRTNLHIFSKAYLQSQQFEEFLKHATA